MKSFTHTKQRRARKKASSREVQKKYKIYLEPHGISHKKMAELDALEVYYPGGIVGFVDAALSELKSSQNVEKT